MIVQQEKRGNMKTVKTLKVTEAQAKKVLEAVITAYGIEADEAQPVLRERADREGFYEVTWEDGGYGWATDWNNDRDPQGTFCEPENGFTLHITREGK